VSVSYVSHIPTYVSFFLYRYVYICVTHLERIHKYVAQMYVPYTYLSYIHMYLSLSMKYVYICVTHLGRIQMYVAQMQVPYTYLSYIHMYLSLSIDVYIYHISTRRMYIYHISTHICVTHLERIMPLKCMYLTCISHTFLDGYCSTLQGLLDWFEVDLGFTELLCVSYVYQKNVYQMYVCYVYLTYIPMYLSPSIDVYIYIQISP